MGTRPPKILNLYRREQDWDQGQWGKEQTKEVSPDSMLAVYGPRSFISSETLIALGHSHEMCVCVAGETQCKIRAHRDAGLGFFLLTESTSEALKPEMVASVPLDLSLHTPAPRSRGDRDRSPPATFYSPEKDRGTNHLLTTHPA